MTITIGPDELASLVRTGGKTTILASMWRPGEDIGFRKYQSEHIPTSFFCDPAAALAGVPSSQEGRNPLPDPDKLQGWFRTWGLKRNRTVVVYDEGRGLFAARAWWVLTWAGLTDVRILDGGLEAWEACGYDIVGGPGGISSGCEVQVNEGQLPVATADDIRAGGATLLDCREQSRFSGRKEHLDLRAGHIPGAVNLPSRDLMTAEGKYRSPEEIREQLHAVGIQEDSDVIVYSGSGLHSAQTIAAMRMAGFKDASMYLGGWSQWSADRSNPVEIGF